MVKHLINALGQLPNHVESTINKHVVAAHAGRYPHDRGPQAKPEDEFKALWPVRKVDKGKAKKGLGMVGGLGSLASSGSSTSAGQSSRPSTRGSRVSMSSRFSITYSPPALAGLDQEGKTARQSISAISDWRSQATAHQHRRKEAVRQRSEDERFRKQQENIEINDQIDRRQSMRASITQTNSLPYALLEQKNFGQQQSDNSEFMGSIFGNQSAWPSTGNQSARPKNQSPAINSSGQSKTVIDKRRTSDASGLGGNRPQNLDDKSLSSFAKPRPSLRGSRAPSIEEDHTSEDHRRGSKNSSSKPAPSRFESMEHNLDNEPQQKVDTILQLAKRHGLTVADCQAAWQEFAKFDLDGNGQLTTSEFIQSLKVRLKLKPGQDIPKHFLNASWFDADFNINDGALNFEEFLLWRHRHNFSEDLILENREKHMRDLARQHGIPIWAAEDVIKIFYRFDEDQSGTIEKPEFKKLLNQLLKPQSIKGGRQGANSDSDMPEKRLDRYWNEIDADQDGVVTLEEFVVWYMKYFHVAEPDMSDPCRVVTQAYACLAVNRFHPLGNYDED